MLPVVLLDVLRQLVERGKRRLQKSFGLAKGRQVVDGQLESPDAAAERALVHAEHGVADDQRAAIERAGCVRMTGQVQRGVIKGCVAVERESGRHVPLPDVDFQYTSDYPASRGDTI